MKQRWLGTTVLLAALAMLGAGPVDPSVSTVLDAAASGDIETLRALVREGRDVNMASGDGTTALHWASERGHLEMIELLLYAGANVNATTRLSAYSPLLLAARSGHAFAIERLLQAGAPADSATTSGTTALMFSAASGNVRAVEALVDAGADVNRAESTGGHTALMFAAAYGRPEVIELLSSRGADPSLATEIVDTPTLNEELDEGFRDRIEQLRKDRAAAAGDETEALGQTEETEKPKRNFFARLFGWMSPGGEKAEEPRQRRRRESFGARVGMQGGMTALLYASRQGDAASVDALVEAGAEIDQVASGSKTSPLLIATMNGHFDLAKDLLARGADPTLAAEPSNITPLYAAINLEWAPHAMYPQPTAHKQQRTTYLDLMKALLDAGADPNVRLTKKVWFMHYNFDVSGIDETGATPFWRAAYGSDIPAMKLLRSYGADPNIRTKKTAYRRFRAVELEGKDPSGLPPVPEGGPSMTALHAATGAGFGEGFAANDHRNHPAGFLPAVKYLVEECGADVNARDHDGTTPLHNAAARGDVEMIHYLVSKGADVTLLNRKGQSTADMANGPVQRIQPFPEARDLLVSLGAVNHDRCVSC